MGVRRSQAAAHRRPATRVPCSLGGVAVVHPRRRKSNPINIIERAFDEATGGEQRKTEEPEPQKPGRKPSTV